MKLGRRAPNCAPETIHGESARTANIRQNSPGITTRRRPRAKRGSRNASNIHKKLNGIALAKANATRPRITVASKSRVDRAKETDAIHPAIAHTVSANKRLTRAFESRQKTKTPRPMRITHKARMLTTRGAIGIESGDHDRGRRPMTRAETLPPKLWPLMRT